MFSLSARLRALSAAATATLMACRLATHLRAVGSVTGGGLQVLGAGLARDSRYFSSSSLCERGVGGGVASSPAEAADSSNSGLHVCNIPKIHPNKLLAKNIFQNLFVAELKSFTAIRRPGTKNQISVLTPNSIIV